jgi:hypothetical protein
MGFWSGFEGLTGHQPGAFKGFSFKDILDKDMWERRERLGGRQSRQFENTGVVPTTNWYTGGGTTGRGRPEMMGPKVGAAGGRNLTNQPTSAMMDEWVRESQVPSVRHDAPTYQDRFDATTLANQQRRNALWGSGPATVSAARPWANVDPGVSLMNRTPAPSSRGFVSPAVGMLPAAGRDRPFPMADKKTVKKIFADPNKSDEIIETIEEKVPTGPAYNRPPPNWLERVSHGEGPINPGYFSRPTTFSSPTRPEGQLSIMNMNRGLTSVPEDEIRRLDEILKAMEARRGY